MKFLAAAAVFAASICAVDARIAKGDINERELVEFGIDSSMSILSDGMVQLSSSVEFDGINDNGSSKASKQPGNTVSGKSGKSVCSIDALIGTSHRATATYIGEGGLWTTSSYVINVVPPNAIGSGNGVVELQICGLPLSVTVVQTGPAKGGIFPFALLLPVDGSWTSQGIGEYNCGTGEIYVGGWILGFGPGPTKGKISATPLPCS